MSYTNITIWASLKKLLAKALYLSWPIVSHKLNIYSFSRYVNFFSKNENVFVVNLAGSNSSPTLTFIKFVYA